MTWVFWLVALVFVLGAIFFVSRPLSKDGRYGWPSLLVAALIPMLAFGVYLLVGTPAAIEPGVKHAVAGAGTMSATNATASDRENGNAETGSVSSLVGGLEEKLKNNPDDANGWLLLARSYHHIGDFAKARDAYDNAAERGASDPELLGRLEGGAADASATADSELAISGSLTASSDALALIPPTAAIYVMAKSPDGAKMPIAVAKYMASDLPIAFSLTSRNVMIPGSDLAAYEDLLISARVSPDGNALTSMPGVSSTTKSSTLNATDVALTLELSASGG